MPHEPPETWVEEFRRRVPTLSFADKTVPCQPVLRLQFDGTEEAFHAALYRLLVATANLRSPAEEFDLTEPDDMALEVMTSVPMALRLLELLVLLQRPQRILEIGTFIGTSALGMARALGPGGRLVTIEQGARFAALARENVQRNGVADRVTLLEGDAAQVLRTLSPSQPFDLIFLDADKERYGLYFTLLDPLLAPGGLLIADDVLFLGDVLNDEPKTSKGRGVKRFLAMARRQPNYRTLLLPISTGMLLMRKQGP